MKKLSYAFTLLLFTFLATTSLIAQSYCAQITAQAVYHTQSSATSYTVKVTVDKEYDQNITVSGTIYQENNRNNNQSFTLTVPSLNTFAETETVLVVPAEENAVVELSSISPSTVTTGGVTYWTQVNGNCPTVIEQLNSIGQLHNDCQDYVLGYITAQNISLEDTTTLKSTMEAKTTEFFQNYSITSNVSYSINFGSGQNSQLYSSANYSSAGASILSDLQSLIANYDEENDASFFSSLTNLQQQAANLSDQKEVYTVGVPVTIALYSFNYWKANAETWKQIFLEQDRVRNARADKKPCNLGLGQLGFSDITGGVNGAMFGGLGAGPLGALAGGVLVGSVASLGNIAGQVMGCIFSWW